jgi:hypothetical protein
MMKSERTKMIEESKVDPDEDMMTRGIRGAMRGAALAGSKVGDFLSTGAQDLKESVQTTGDDIHMLLGTPRGKMREQQLEERSKLNDQRYFEKLLRVGEAKQRKQREAEAELKRESRGMKKGGKVKLSSASKRADGVAARGKTRGRMV